MINTPLTPFKKRSFNYFCSVLQKKLIKFSNYNLIAKSIIKFWYKKNKLDEKACLGEKPKCEKLAVNVGLN